MKIDLLSFKDQHGRIIWKNFRSHLYEYLSTLLFGEHPDYSHEEISSAISTVLDDSAFPEIQKSWKCKFHAKNVKSQRLTRLWVEL